jgi:ABC-type multidrug transport system fused ATPase/permease subunit
MDKELRKFGFSSALGISIAGFIMFLRHKPYFAWFSCIGGVFVIFSILYPLALKPVKKFLDAVIFSFGWLTGFISSLAAFYLIFAPIAILLRLFGRDLLNQKIDKKAASYWMHKEVKKHFEENYEQMG